VRCGTDQILAAVIVISAKWTEWNWRIYCFHFCLSVCQCVCHHHHHHFICSNRTVQM